MIRWLTAMLDTPPETAQAAEQFWRSVTATSLSPRRDVGRFVTFLPENGDAYVRAQVVDTGAGSVHLDLHVDDVGESVDTSLRAGAVATRVDPGIAVMESPGGLPFCLVGWHGERRVPAPVDGTRLDQVCVDIPRGTVVTETAFWDEMLASERPMAFTPDSEFVLYRRNDLPLRVLFQRLDDMDGPVRAHLDIAAGAEAAHVDAAAQRHEGLGATAKKRFPGWQVMEDPAGRRYCLTTRDPVTGQGR